MEAESLRRYLLSLPHVVETVQWGGALVFWATEKSIGGKIFAIINLDDFDHHDRQKPVLSFATSPEIYPELLEVDGIIPAPYLARANWVALQHWRVFRTAELQALLSDAYHLVFAKLPAHTRALLAQPTAQRKKLIAQSRRLKAQQKPLLSSPAPASNKKAAKRAPRQK